MRTVGSLVTGARSRFRAVAVRVVKRTGLVPSDTPDLLGEDSRLGTSALEADIVVFFGDTVDALYQLEHWYAAFRAVNKAHRIVVVVQDSRVAARVRRDAGLPVIVVARIATLDGLLCRSGVRVALYVAHSPRNFALLRFPSLAHVSLLHGDSDKTVSVSNQTKAYDFALVAGQAAIDRAGQNLPLFDTSRLLPVGRPNLDAEYLESAARPTPPVRPAGRPTVLYAPTWEGAQVTASYTSVASHGERIVRALLDASYRVVYRPHPLTGVRLTEVGEADARIRQMIARAIRASPGAGHRVDHDVPVITSFAGADLLICDISALSVEWLPSEKPLIITVPVGERVEIAATQLEDVVPRLPVSGLGHLADLVRRELRDDSSRARRADLVEYYVGDVTPGAAVRAMVGALEQVIRWRDAEWARVSGNGATGP